MLYEVITLLLERRDVLLGLQFPSDFSRDVAAGRPAQVQVILDGRRANAAQVTLSYLVVIARELGMELARMDPLYTEPPRAEVRHWFNPNLEYP